MQLRGWGVVRVAGAVFGAAVAADAGFERLRLRIQEQEAAAIGVNPLKDQVHDPPQKLVDVQRMADRQGGAVHDLEIAAGAGEPIALRLVEVGGEKLAAFVLAHGADDSRALGIAAVGNDLDVFVATGGRVLAAGVEHDRAAELDLVASGELVALDAAVIDEGAVGAALVEEDQGLADVAEFGVLAGNFGVVQLDRATQVAAESNSDLGEGELEAVPLIATLDNEQRRHGDGSPERAWHARPEAPRRDAVSLDRAAECHPARPVARFGQRSGRSIAGGQKLLDFRDQRPIMVGFGDQGASGETLAAAGGAEHDQRGGIGGGSGELLRGDELTGGFAL